MEYKVLWIDDDYSIVDAYQTDAEDGYSIDLIHKGNWEDGKKYLIENFNEITAIILDANCKIKSDGVTEGNIFLATVTPELQQLFGERNNSIPWYILSAGRGEDFEPITRCVTAARKSFNEEWGEAIFFKDAIEESDENIAEIQRNELAMSVGCAPSQINYVLSSRFTPEQGYMIESRRGGGGYVKITRIMLNRSSAIMHIINSIGTRLNPIDARIIIENCKQSNLITNDAAVLISAAVSNSALMSVPQEYREFIRASLIKQMLITQI